MFSARRVEGVWKLAFNRGAVIDTAWADRTGDTKVVLSFPSQLKAQACVRALNDKYFAEYSKYINRDSKLVDESVPVPNELRSAMMAEITQHLK